MNWREGWRRGEGGEEGGVEGEIGAEFGEGGDHFGGAAVGVEQETTRGTGGGAERVVEEAEGVEAVDGDREIAFGGEGKLEEEDFELLLDRRAAEASEARFVGARTIEHPAVEADFADEGW